MDATVIIPTHEHVETVEYAVKSARCQTVEAIEILVAGDGAPPAMAEVMSRLASEDSRIRYFDCEKGPRHGELNRARVLEGARGRVVCYLCDDDLWAPTHVERMCEALEDADFAHSLEVLLPAEEGELPAVNGFDIGHAADRAALLNGNEGFGLSCGAHTMEAYRRLPHGWRTTPAGIHTDVYMWRQFVEQDWCRAASVGAATVYKFAAPPRRGWSVERRRQELEDWSGRISSKGFEGRMHGALIRGLWRQAREGRERTGWIRVGVGDCYAEYFAGERITFAAAGNASRYLSWGWGEGEEWGRWTDGAEARLTMTVNGAEGWVELHAAVQGFVGPRARMIEVAVTCNGGTVDRWVFTSTKIEVKRFKVRLCGRRIDLRFQSGGASRASKRADTTDERRLGLGVAWLRAQSMG